MKVNILKFFVKFELKILKTYAMKRFLLITLFFSFNLSLTAQIADGSVAPDFTATDIDGNSHSLQTYLNQGKTVILNVSATWCGPCWNYKQTGALSDIYYAYGEHGSDEVVILYIEGDASTGINELNGIGPGTVGDWVSTTPFPIIDDASIANDYQISYFPTVFRICPDGLVYEMGQLPNTDIVTDLNINCSSSLSGVANHIKVEDAISICEDASVSSFNVSLKNFGNNTISSVSFDVISGTNVTPVTQSVDLDTFEETSIAVNAFVDSSLDNSVLFTSINSNPPFVSVYNTQDIEVSATQASTDEANIEVHVKTDNYPSEITWTLKDDSGAEIASGGPYQPGTDDQWGGGGPDAMTTITQNVSLPNNTACYSLELFDSFGDGWGLTDGSITPGIDIIANAQTVYSTGNVGNFGTELVIFNAFRYNQNFSVEDSVLDDFNFYPNPTQGMIYFSTPNALKIDVIDLNGKLVYRANVDANGELDLSSLNSGLYIMKATFQNITKTEKLIIK